MSVTDIALATIQAEHRALSAVLHTFQELLGKVEAGYGAPDFGLFSAMLYYIDDFQERCHHPKEEKYIFDSLRAATPEFDGVISELQAEHVKGAQAVSRLHRCLVFYQGGMPGGIGMLKAGVDDYIARMHEHMRCEEALFERSRAVIVEHDWARIAAAFDENDDPLFGSNRRQAFGQLYQRILVLAPHKLKQGMSPASRF
ncbi:MAG: hemerythrin domain-containing protein [Burkholderiales bacterium]